MTAKPRQAIWCGISKFGKQINLSAEMEPRDRFKKLRNMWRRWIRKRWSFCSYPMVGNLMQPFFILRVFMWQDSHIEALSICIQRVSLELWKLGFTNLAPAVFVYMEWRKSGKSLDAIDNCRGWRRVLLSKLFCIVLLVTSCFHIWASQWTASSDDIVWIGLIGSSSYKFWNTRFSHNCR